MIKLPQFKDESLLRLALTHRSYVNEHPNESENNERLEFLGDAVLGYLVGELLYKRYDDMTEAQLTRLRSALVDEKQLAKFATQLGIGELMRLGKGADKDGGRQTLHCLVIPLKRLLGHIFSIQQLLRFVLL